MTLPASTTRTLNAFISNALETYSGDPANLVDDGGFKLFQKLRNAGRIFAVQDGERVQHPILHNSDGTSNVRYVGDDYAGSEDGNIGKAQNDPLTKALFDLRNVTTNLNLPQTILDRPSVLAMDDVQALTKRKMMNILAEEEFYFLRGASTATGTEAMLSPHSADTAYSASAGSMSALGLLKIGQGIAVINPDTEKFANIDTEDGGDGDSKWRPQLYQASTAAATDLDEVLGDLQTSFRDASRFGGLERPTHVMTTGAMYDKIAEALREKVTINDTVVRDMGAEDEIPFRGVMIDWSQYLEKDTLWDFTNESTAEVPFMMLNLNSLRFNLVYGGSVDQGGGFVKRMSDLAPHPQDPKFFTRLAYKYCWSLDNGRRSFGQIEGWTVA